jgi:pyruvate dehydrogenase kinase 2/3/4
MDPSTATSVALSSERVSELLRECGLEREFLEHLAHQRPLPLRLKDMYQYGTSTDVGQRLRNAQFLYKELPVRIAQRAVDLLTLPHGLSEATPIRQVARIYLQFLRRFQEFPYPTTVEQEGLFTDMLHSFLLDRASVPVSIAQGVKAWWLKEQHGDTNDRLQEMEEALYRFFTARVGLRFLTEHFVLSSNRESARTLRSMTDIFPVPDGSSSSSGDDRKARGCIHANVDVVQEVRRAAELVTYQTKGYYDGLCPKIDIVDCVSNHEFTHVPHHLHYMISELLKNACRASVRMYKERVAVAGSDEDIEIPSIRVIVVKGEEDVTIKVADRGGGIKRSLMATIWKFAHSTASEDEQHAEFGTDGESGARIRGFGLPLARIYARYFGGELTLKSTEGYGLDAYLHLPRLGDSCESLPLRVRDSPGDRDSLPAPKTTLTSLPQPVRAARPMRYFSSQHPRQIDPTSSNRSVATM